MMKTSFSSIFAGTRYGGVRLRIMAGFVGAIFAVILLGCAPDDGEKSSAMAEKSEEEKSSRKVNPDWMKSKSTQSQPVNSGSSAGVGGFGKSDTNSNPRTGPGTAANIPTSPGASTGNSSTGNSSTGKSPSTGTKTADGQQQSVVRPKGDTGGSATQTKTATQSGPDKVTADGTGETTELMAKLTNLLRQSTQFFAEMERKQMTAEQAVEVRKQFASMVEEQLTYANQLLKRQLRESDREMVVKAKLESHQRLAGLNRPEHEAKLYEFGATLKNDPNDEIKKQYEFVMLQKQFVEVLRGNKIDEKSFFDRMEKIVSFWRDDVEVYQRAELWITGLYNSGNRDYFIRALELCADAFYKSTNEQLLTRSEIMRDRLTLAKLGFDLAIVDVADGKEGANAKLLETVGRVLAQPDLSAYVLTQVAQAGLQLEVKHDYKTAREYYALIGEQIKKLKNPNLRNAVQRLVDNAMVRYDMIGKPLKVEGMIPEIQGGQFTRKPIDFSSYRGKVVILFFWAISNRPSYELLKDLDQLYMANKDKQLAVIGINADEDMGTISQVMQFEAPRRKWTHLMPVNPEILGLKTAMAKRCGVDSMPYNILIDKDGKVVDIRVYGRALEDRVSELLGEPIKRIYPEPPESKLEVTGEKDGKEGKDTSDEQTSDAEATETDASKGDAPPKKSDSDDEEKGGENLPAANSKSADPETNETSDSPEASSSSEKKPSTKPEPSAKKEPDVNPEKQKTEEKKDATESSSPPSGNSQADAKPDKNNG